MAGSGNMQGMAAAASKIEVDVVRVGATTTVFVRGDIDLAAAPELGRALAGNAGTGTELVVDLRQVAFLDCATLRVLLTAQRTQHALGGTLRCTGARGLVRKVFQLTGAARQLGC
ncbi:STAS domain-containing protein [Crossiella sp. SN42]|uniref:STAS domain-containing protein n=1 Tax=Crossiella sp. SN42 TaxID=2944808 RepID=UPI00207C3B07|nr:STAS domain-containing protein [Crossiella sp. SN42]MCO1577428.1 STAS domain-containing protein [Crossiella sp. SN42]